MRVVAVGGVPGVGKTTLVKAAIAPWVGSARKKFGLLEYTDYTNPAVRVLGYYADDVFGGTDRLSMAVQPSAEQFIREQSDAFDSGPVLFEGDRLFNVSFLQECVACAHLTIVEASAPREVLLERRQHRSAEVGKAQDETWLKGRTSKVENVLRWARLSKVHIVTLSTTSDTSADELRQLVLAT